MVWIQGEPCRPWSTVGEFVNIVIGPLQMVFGRSPLPIRVEPWSRLPDIGSAVALIESFRQHKNLGAYQVYFWRFRPPAFSVVCRTASDNEAIWEPSQRSAHPRARTRRQMLSHLRLTLSPACVDATLPSGTRVEVHVPGAEPRCQRKSLRDFAAFGMWANREDIPDGVTYEDRMRQPRY